jgi:hypothetical protein
MGIKEEIKEFQKKFPNNTIEFIEDPNMFEDVVLIKISNEMYLCSYDENKIIQAKSLGKLYPEELYKPIEIPMPKFKSNNLLFAEYFRVV